MARIERKNEFIGSGAIVQLVGLLLLFVFPIGTVLGIVLLIMGGRMAQPLCCSACGTKVTSKNLTICPGCRSEFTK